MPVSSFFSSATLATVSKPGLCLTSCMEYLSPHRGRTVSCQCLLPEPSRPLALALHTSLSFCCVSGSWKRLSWFWAWLYPFDFFLFIFYVSLLYVKSERLHQTWAYYVIIFRRSVFVFFLTFCLEIISTLQKACMNGRTPVYFLSRFTFFSTLPQLLYYFICTLMLMLSHVHTLSFFLSVWHFLNHLRVSCIYHGPKHFRVYFMRIKILFYITTL